MTYYVAHEYGGKLENIEIAKQKVHDMQVNDKDNLYICPLLVFEHLQYGEIGYDEEMELCFDLLCLCDELIVASDVSKGVQAEIDMAKRINMPMRFI